MLIGQRELLCHDNVCRGLELRNGGIEVAEVTSETDYISFLCFLF